MQLRHPQPDPPQNEEAGGCARRLNLLLTYGGWRERPTIEQLARVLAPLGIDSIQVRTGEEAAELIRHRPIHIAVVDLAIPLRAAAEDRGTSSTAGAAGGRLLQLLRRLDSPPPTVIVRPPQPAVRESVRGLGEALREGAFAVVDRPVSLETMLEIMRRIVRRHYADHWPAA